MWHRVIAAAGLSDRVECIEGDYCDLPALKPADVAYAIESFVHGPSRALLRTVPPCDQARGLLVVCDDVRGGGSSPRAVSARWRNSPGVGRSALCSIRTPRCPGARWVPARIHDDLTPFIEVTRARDRVIAIEVAVLKRLPFDGDRFDYVIGGDALQTCLAHGWI